MATSGQIAGDSALTATDLDGSLSRGREEWIKEDIPVEPIGVVLGGARPPDPVLGLRLPLPIAHLSKPRSGGGSICPNRAESSHPPGVLAHIQLLCPPSSH